MYGIIDNVPGEPSETKYRPETYEEKIAYEHINDEEITELKITYTNRTEEEFDVFKFLEWFYEYLEKHPTEEKISINASMMHKAGLLASSDVTVKQFQKLAWTIYSINFELKKKRGYQCSISLVSSISEIYLTYYHETHFTKPDANSLLAGPVLGVTCKPVKSSVWAMERILNEPDKDKIEIVEK